MRKLFLACLPAFSALYIWQSSDLPAGNTLIGARTFPLLIGGIMLAVSLILVWQEFRPLTARNETEKKPAESDGEAPIADWPAVWVVIGGIVAFVLLLRPIGFVLAIALFLFGLSTFFSPKQWRTNLAVGIGFSLATYALFTQFLGIPLPNGPLRPLF